MSVGRHIAGLACFRVPLHGAEVAIELRVRNTAANRYYAGTAFAATPAPSGILRPPILVDVSSALAIMA